MDGIYQDMNQLGLQMRAKKATLSDVKNRLEFHKQRLRQTPVKEEGTAQHIRIVVANYLQFMQIPRRESNGGATRRRRESSRRRDERSNERRLRLRSMRGRKRLPAPNSTPKWLRWDLISHSVAARNRDDYTLWMRILSHFPVVIKVQQAI